MSRFWASAFAVLLLALGVSACHGDAASDESLELRRADGSRIAFGEAEPAVWCDRDQVYAALGRLGKANRGDPAWILQAPLGEVEPGVSLRLPHGDSEGVLLFALVPPRIEASSAEEEARGRLTVERAACEEGAEVAFSVEGTLGSEFFEGEDIRVRGSFSGRVGAAPDWWEARPR